MSKTTKWALVLAIIALIIIGLWWSGLFSGVKPVAEKGAQAAAALNSDSAPIDFSDAKIAEDSAAIDAQMKTAGNAFAIFSQAPTAAKADIISRQFGNVTAIMTKLSSRIQARVANLKSVGVNTDEVQGAVSDLNIQISYSDSESGLASQIISGIKPFNGDQALAQKNKASLQQALIELEKSESYLKAARNDIKKAVQSLKSVKTS